MIHISEDLRAPAVIVKIIKQEKDCPCLKNLEMFMNNTVLAYRFFEEEKTLNKELG